MFANFLGKRSMWLSPNSSNPDIPPAMDSNSISMASSASWPPNYIILTCTYTPAIYRQICILSSPNSSNPDIPTSNGLKLYFNWQWPLQHHDFQVILFLHAHIPPQFIDKQQHDFQVILFLHAHIPPQYIDKQHTVKSKFFQSRYPTSNGLKLYFTWQWPL